MSAISRKGLLAAAGASVVAACGSSDEEARKRQARTAADLEIVRFLLFVEHVSTAFWDEVLQRSAVAGRAAQDLAQALARNEREHVATLARFERRLADRTSAPPRTTFGDIFAAGPREVLRSGAELANIAAAGYLGQTNRIQDRNILASVLAIHTVEGRQAAALNRVAGQPEKVLPGGAFAEPLSMNAVRHRLRRFATS